MSHSFDVADAERYGLNQAVILHHLKFWIAKNKADQTHFYDGYYWTYSSVKAMTELFPYFTERSIRNAIDKLEKSGAIVCGNYNKSPYDRTRWIRVYDEIDLPVFVNGKTPLSKTVNKDISKDNIYTYFPEVNKQLLDDWMIIRNNKKCPMTKTASDLIKKHASILGWSNEQAITECIQRNWASFNSKWLDEVAKSSERKGTAEDREEKWE